MVSSRASERFFHLFSKTRALASDFLARPPGLGNGLLQGQVFRLRLLPGRQLRLKLLLGLLHGLAPQLHQFFQFAALPLPLYLRPFELGQLQFEALLPCLQPFALSGFLAGLLRELLHLSRMGGRRRFQFEAFGLRFLKRLAGLSDFLRQPFILLF